VEKRIGIELAQYKVNIIVEDALTEGGNDFYLLKAVGSTTQVSQHFFVLILWRAHVCVLLW